MFGGVTMVFKGLCDGKQEILLKLLQRLHIKPVGDFVVNFEKSDFFRVKKQGNEVFVNYENDSEIYRSLLLITDLIYKNEDGEINEKPCFDVSGVMIDMSRAGVMTVETIKEYMDYMALMGLNSLMLYMEDVYEVEGYEYFGYMRGRYTKEELAEIDAYGQALNIEVIPCIQTLGHYEQYIKWAEGNKISDTSNALMVGMPEVYEFIEAIIKTVSSVFTTKKIHIGMDEVWGMGTGKYLKKNGYKDGIEIFTEHIKRVKDITDKYNLEPMIWSDMFFRLGSETHAYYDKNIKDLSGMRSLIPDDIGLVYWDYYHVDEEFYDFMIKRHKEMSDNIIFAGGIWLWRGFVPDYQHTVNSTNSALKICKQENIRDVYATIWGDDGCETDGMFSLMGCVLYGEHTYNENVSESSLKTRANILFGADMDDFEELTNVLYPLDKFEFGKAILSVKQIIYSDIMCGFVDCEMTDENIPVNYLKLAEKFEKLSQQDGYYKKHYEYIKDICLLAGHKVDISHKLLKNYQKNDEILEEIRDVLLPQLEEDFERLKKIHYEMWNKTYKPFGFEVVDGRYGIKIARIKSAIMRIDDYLSGRVDELPELSEKRLPFNGAMPLAFSHNAIISGYMSRGY